jgi:hypothetical protein
MWDSLTPADILQAKQELNQRHAATLSRHAEEIIGLDAEQAEIETVARVVEAFALKFKKSESTASDEATTAEEEKPSEPASEAAEIPAEDDAEGTTTESTSKPGIRVMYSSPNFARKYR